MASDSETNKLSAETTNAERPKAVAQAEEILRQVSDKASKAGMRSFIVGGAVRDYLMSESGRGSIQSASTEKDSRSEGDVVGERQGTLIRDLDFVIEGDAIEVARQCHAAWGGELKTFDAFGTAKILRPAVFSDWPEVDFAMTRTESYARPGALPIVSPGPLENDLKRRDFSINAMAVATMHAAPLVTGARRQTDSPKEHSEQREIPTALHPYIIDHYDGSEAIRTRLVSVLHSASFLDDPTRLFRAVRYAVRLDFSLDQKTQQLFEEAVNNHRALETISPVRIWNEVRKFLAESKARQMLAGAIDQRLFSFWPPLRGIHAAELLAALPDGPITDQAVLRACLKLRPGSDPRSWGLQLSKTAIHALISRGE